MQGNGPHVDVARPLVAKWLDGSEQDIKDVIRQHGLGDGLAIVAIAFTSCAGSVLHSAGHDEIAVYSMLADLLIMWRDNAIANASEA